MEVKSESESESGAGCSVKRGREAKPKEEGEKAAKVPKAKKRSDLALEEELCAEVATCVSPPKADEDDILAIEFVLNDKLVLLDVKDNTVYDYQNHMPLGKYDAVTKTLVN